MSVPFDEWFSQDIGQGVGMSDPSFTLSESMFSDIQKLSQRQLRGILFSPGSLLHLLVVVGDDDPCDWWGLISHCCFEWHSSSN